MHYRMGNDYTVDWPFWSDEGLCPDGDPSLPPRLEADVRRWAADFNEGYSYEFGWATKLHADEHRRRGVGLFGAVQRAVEADGHTVELAYWETVRRKGL